MSDWSEIHGTISLPYNSRISISDLLLVYFDGNKPAITMHISGSYKVFTLRMHIESTITELMRDLRLFCTGLSEMSSSVRINLNIESPFYYVKDKKCQEFA